MGFLSSYWLGSDPSRTPPCFAALAVDVAVVAEVVIVLVTVDITEVAIRPGYVGSPRTESVYNLKGMRYGAIVARASARNDLGDSGENKKRDWEASGLILHGVLWLARRVRL